MVCRLNALLGVSSASLDDSTNANVLLPFLYITCTLSLSDMITTRAASGMVRPAFPVRRISCNRPCRVSGFVHTLLMSDSVALHRRLRKRSTTS